MILELNRVVVPLPHFALDVDERIDSQALGIAGVSGAGKTSLIETIAGLRAAESGRIAFNGRIFVDIASRTFVPPRERRIGYVPQDETLFPHLSVRKNLLFGSSRGKGGVELDRVADELELTPLLHRNVSRLSGGERRRVAIGRAILSSPELLLLDEPLTGLDPALHDRTRALLLRLQEETALPMILVSHDAADVAELCDTTLVLANGRVQHRISRGRDRRISR